MSLIRYVRKFKEYGFRHSLEIIWQFRIDWLIQNFVVPFVKHKDLENSIIIESHNDFDCKLSISTLLIMDIMRSIRLSGC